MTIGNYTLLAATTSAVASSSFQLTHASENQQATIQVVGLATTEKAYLQIENVLSLTNFVNVKINGSDVYCDVSNNVIYVSGNGRYRINKDSTAGAVGVAITSDKEYNVY